MVGVKNVDSRQSRDVKKTTSQHNPTTLHRFDYNSIISNSMATFRSPTSTLSFPSDSKAQTTTVPLLPTLEGSTDTASSSDPFVLLPKRSLVTMVLPSKPLEQQEVQQISSSS